MDVMTLAEEVIEGRRIGRQDDLDIFLGCDLKKLCEGADSIRACLVGDKVDLCSVINGRSGCCPEDCKYCAQSVHNHTGCEVYDFLPEETIVDACKMNEREGVHRFSIVPSGRALTGEEFENYAAYLHADGVYCWTDEELKDVIVKYNPDATAEMLVEMGAKYSSEDTMERHGVN